jgi:hypothetical protein
VVAGIVRRFAILLSLVVVAACGDTRPADVGGSPPAPSDAAASPPFPCPPQCETTPDGGARFLTARAMAQVRAAAWQRLMPFAPKDEGLPDPQTWTPVTAIFPVRTSADGVLPLKVDLLRQQGQKPVLYEATFLNTTATRFVRTARLNVRTTTDVLRAAFAREIEMPPDSQALKMFFYRIRQPQEKVYVRIWDWNAVKVRNAANLDDSMMATQCVQLMTTAAECIAARGNFYTIKVDDSNKALFTCGVQCPPAQKDDVLILVGMHITSKQTPEWLWATFWWRGEDRFKGSYWTCQNAQRPAALDNEQPWKYYSMDATASLTLGKPMRPEDPGDMRCGLPPRLGTANDPDLYRQQFWAAYNPFVEAGLLNGLKSTCVNCHARASTTSVNDRAFVPSISDPLSPHFSQLEGHIRLDYLWTLGRTLAPTSFP